MAELVRRDGRLLPFDETTYAFEDHETQTQTLRDGVGPGQACPSTSQVKSSLTSPSAASSFGYHGTAFSIFPPPTLLFLSLSWSSSLLGRRHVVCSPLAPGNRRHV
eukprot:3190441-Prymnesium_polylepis.1